MDGQPVLECRSLRRSSPGATLVRVAEPDYRARASAGITALQRWYDPASGLWRGTGWWNCANALTAVIRYTKLTGDHTHAGVIATTFTAAQRQHAGFVNDYYDDNGWWALAWVTAFDVTRDSRYLDMAQAIFARNAAAWTGACGGGLIWNTTSTYKNAITNELFLTLAAHRAFILANAGSLWDCGRNAAGEFGLRWAGPFDRGDAARQSSALDALIAAAAFSA